MKKNELFYVVFIRAEGYLTCRIITKGIKPPVIAQHTQSLCVVLVD